jgi:hypothetical protein
MCVDLPIIPTTMVHTVVVLVFTYQGIGTKLRLTESTTGANQKKPQKQFLITLSPAQTGENSWNHQASSVD